MLLASLHHGVARLVGRQESSTDVQAYGQHHCRCVFVRLGFLACALGAGGGRNRIDRRVYRTGRPGRDPVGISLPTVIRCLGGGEA